MDPKEDRLADDFLSAWIDAQALRATNQDPSQTTPPELLDEAALSAMFERTARCAKAIHAVWPGKADAFVADDDPYATREWSGIDVVPPLAPPRIQQFGRFQIERLLGRGGMGAVFLAFDPHLSRRVALKIPHPGSLVDGEIRERFLREARAAGGLRHAGIVPVFESGREGDVCYLVSEFCDGPNLAEWLHRRNQPVPVRMAAAIVARLAGAVQHAHDRGILHRDLKPANVLLDHVGDTTMSDAPGGRHSAIDEPLPFTPRITDFGLAQLADDEQTLTRTGAAIGTAAYMAPEQAAGRRDAIGPHTDVFALGAILYEMLSGEPPFGKESAAAILAALRQFDPTPLVRQRREVPRDLDAICLKCLEKRPQRRYQSAAELRSDLARFLRGEPTLARPVSAPERWLRWARRSPSAAALIALSTATLICLFIGLAWHSHRLADALTLAQEARHYAEIERSRAEQAAEQATAQRRRAEMGELRARQLLYAADMARALQAWRMKEHLAVLEILPQHVPASDEHDLRGFEWRFLEASCRPTPEKEFRHGAAIRHCAATPDGNRLITAGDDACIRVWDMEAGALDAVLQGHVGVVRAVAVSPDGAWLVSGGDDNLVMLWDLKKLRPARILGAHATGVETAAWSPNGQWIATGARYSDVRLWSPDEGRVLTIKDDGRHESLVFSADSRQLFLPQKHQLVMWDLVQRKELQTLDAIDRTGPRAMCALANGSLLACTDRFDPQIILFDPSSNTRVASLLGDCQYSNGFAASPDGRYLASAGTDGAVRLFDVSDFDGARSSAAKAGRMKKGGVELTIVAHEKQATAVAFLNDSLLATTGDEGVARIWDVHRLTDWRRLGPVGHVNQVNLSPDGEALCIGRQKEPKPLTISLTDPQGRVDSTVAPRAGILSPKGRWFATARDAGEIVIWDRQLQQVHGTLDCGPLLPDPSPVLSLSFSTSDDNLAVGYQDGAILVWNVEQQRILQNFQLNGSCPCVRFSNDGRQLAAADTSNGFWVWEWKSGRVVRRVESASWGSHALAWSFDDRLLAIAQDDETLVLWDAKTWQAQTRFTGHSRRIDCVKFTPDGQTLLSGAADGSIRLWHTPTGRPLGVLYQSEWPEEFINDIVVSPDGRFLAAGTQQTNQQGILVSRAFDDHHRKPNTAP